MRLTILAMVIPAVLSASVALATPILDVDHPMLVAVGPPGHTRYDAPQMELHFAEYFADLPDFFRGMDPATLPEGFIVHGHGVALFYRGDGTVPDASGALAPDGGLTSAGLPYGSATGAQDVPVPTPEPGSLILLGSGLVYSAARIVRARSRR
jgi:PEP-CTERM motif